MKDDQELALDKIVAINEDLEKFRKSVQDQRIKDILYNAIFFLSMAYQQIGELDD